MKKECESVRGAALIARAESPQLSIGSNASLLTRSLHDCISNGSAYLMLSHFYTHVVARVPLSYRIEALHRKQMVCEKRIQRFCAN
jgi:hypothetical protein